MKEADFAHANEEHGNGIEHPTDLGRVLPVVLKEDYPDGKSI